jgi:hypothetical protein
MIFRKPKTLGYTALGHVHHCEKKMFFAAPSLNFYPYFTISWIDIGLGNIEGH